MLRLLLIHGMIFTNNSERKLKVIYSRLSRHGTARESSAGLVPVRPTKVKACKSIQFTEGTLEVKTKNTCLIQLRHYTVYIR